MNIIIIIVVATFSKEVSKASDIYKSQTITGHSLKTKSLLSLFCKRFLNRKKRTDKNRYLLFCTVDTTRHYYLFLVRVTVLYLCVAISI